MEDLCELLLAIIINALNSTKMLHNALYYRECLNHKYNKSANVDCSSDSLLSYLCETIDGFLIYSQWFRFIIINFIFCLDI